MKTNTTKAEILASSEDMTPIDGYVDVTASNPSQLPMTLLRHALAAPYGEC